MATEIRLNEAIAFAAMAHAGQLDKAGEPYILHPLRVMLRMTTEEERIVAVLHDVVEDCPDITLGEIAEKFGTTIGLAVDALTHEKNEPRDVYIRRVNRNPLARAVKLLDIADNMDRMHKLPVDVHLRLIKKYGDALTILHSSPEFPTEPSTNEAASGVEGAHEGTTADEKAELPREHQCVSANDCPLCDEYIPAGSREPEKLNNAQKSVAAAAEPHHRKCGLLHGDTACNCSLWHALCNIQDYIVCEEETPERKLYVVGNELIERIKQNFALAESSLSSPPPEK